MNSRTAKDAAPRTAEAADTGCPLSGSLAHSAGGPEGASAGDARIDSSAEAKYVHILCPRCGADDARFRYRLEVSSIVSCRACGQSYVDPRVSSVDLERKLQQWAEQDVVDDERLCSAFEPGSLQYYARFLTWMTRYASGPGRRLLDIGCSTGAFLTVAREAGWQVQGVEIGRASATYARDVLGLDVRRGSLYEVDAPPSSFDGVAMIEVIEHLEHPRLALDRVRRLLKPDGVLLVTTPNFDSLYRRLFGSRWWVINCEDEHIVLFNLTTLVGMLDDAGFDVLFRHIRGVDFMGLLREAKRGRLGAVPALSPPGAAVKGYYEARSAKARVKALLGSVGILKLTRSLLRGLDHSYAWRASPTHAWGEQLVVVARRRPDIT